MQSRLWCLCLKHVAAGVLLHRQQHNDDAYKHRNMLNHASHLVDDATAGLPESNAILSTSSGEEVINLFVCDLGVLQICHSPILAMPAHPQSLSIHLRDQREGLIWHAYEHCAPVGV